MSPRLGPAPPHVWSYVRHRGDLCLQERGESATVCTSCHLCPEQLRCPDRACQKAFTGPCSGGVNSDNEMCRACYMPEVTFMLTAISAFS